MNKAASLILITRTGKVLLHERDRYALHFPACLGLPGGAKEKQDKSIVNTLLRETFEETGIILTNYSFFRLFIVHCYEYVFVSQINKPTSTHVGEGIAFHWVPIAAVFNPTTPLSDYHRGILFAFFNECNK